ncbi:pyruvate kinase [Tenacibaculum mesophilum]|uniref:Pyruvate kinase n=1 Tax=Tenacibaculum mesophilum TaxID=104268 RepID=A0AAE9MNX9_9FLAO|nr:pyruvate kinase [Tenacibaculum mesophilum]UTD15528.1 pyruvate kinase [Tenacibaculum mesophilum]GFD72475.1 pyruvate kinase [Tenacibaculum sp. KUL113]GFD78360.1 pyruvate kinase [Tenacibaculum sp. KUL118]|eukprot:TRINITY_DN5997_c0_g1_i2.p1 TRINITY_DN5997_c0_g1~~TRINITY_DN5997_c0_g1_i2.p1  ORF type:complete len:476 (-),score=103.58 TRINITY_DN5997_c0_g1_i2:103-1530(-)
MPHNKKTKIVATLGPATNTKEILANMAAAGVNVFRINFSHADYEVVKERIRQIREINDERGYNVAILADLQGPKLRVGVMQEGVELEAGDTFTFTTEKCEGTQEKAFMTYQHFPKDVKVGEKILVDDGKLMFEVTATNKENEVVTKVIVGGALKSKKGVNLPNTKISLPALTEKDKKDVVFALEQEVDWIALSFVRTPEDLRILRDIIKQKSRYRVPVIAKIEKPEAVENIDALIPYCDGLMVARGDLGVEVPMQDVPLIQKMLVRRAKQARIPVIIATQMMETMIENSVPTRAEVNDVANSIMDGADAVMLSGETSVGKHPIRVIQKMTEIIGSVEFSDLIKVPQEPPHIRTKRFITKSVCHHAALMADDINAAAISTLTNSGYTAFQISAWRPKSHVLAFSSEKRILGKLNLLWGVRAYFYDRELSTDDTIEDINEIAKEKGYVKTGDFMINLSSMPVKAKGMVNTLRVSHID